MTGSKQNAGQGWQRLFEPVVGLSPALLICIGSLLISILGTIFYAWPSRQHDVQLLEDRLSRCRAIKADTARLSCYDHLPSMQPAKGADAPAVPQRN